MSADPADRTATLQPTTPSAAVVREAAPPERAESAESAGDDELPIDDPERYEQVGEHARGGLGRVIRAVDKRLGRTVAVKELLRHDEWHEARFVREALITARLEHPGIVPVHEAGRWPNGSPYYVMKLVEGRTLKELFAQNPTQGGRLALLGHVIAIADAVGYAHSEGVIHRDLKPSNVIVGEFGETIVIDWGLARDTRRDGVPEPAPELVRAVGSASTISGKVVGTPAYMAPEQARGELVDERADVYAIGAVLYELLAGKVPHADTTPEAVLERVVAGPPEPLSTVAPDAPPELVGIVQKAMARQPSDRYANGSALAEDLRRFQTGKLVTAHAYTPWHLIRKRLRQHRGVVVVAAASAIALAAIGVESFRTVVAERDLARSAGERAELARKSAEARKRELVLVQAQTSLRKDPTAALAWLKLHPVTDADRTQVVDVIDEALAIGAARHVFRPGDWVFDTHFTPDGKTLLAAVRDGRIRAYDLATGAMRELGQARGGVEALAVSPDGAWVASGGAFGEVALWPLTAAGEKRVLVERGREVMTLRFDDTGTRVLVGHEGTMEVVGLDGSIEKVGTDSMARSAFAIGNLDRRVVQVGPNQIAAVTDRGETRLLASLQRNIAHVAISPDGERVLVHDTEALWSVPHAGGAPTKLAAYEGRLSEIAWSPDGKTIALLGTRPDVPLVELATGATRDLRGHTDALYNAQFSRDGSSLLTASDDGSARVWNLGDGSSLVLRGHDDDVYRARFSPDEKSVATASLDGSLRVWPIDRTGARVLQEGGEILELYLDGDQVLVKTTNGIARWSLERGTREPLFDRAGLGIGVPSPDGQQLVVQTADWSLGLRRRDGTTLPLRGHRAYITDVEWSRDSKAVFSSSVDGTLRTWNLETGTSTNLVEGDVPVRGFAVAADGRIATQVGDRALMLYPDGRTETIGEGASWCHIGAQFEPVRDRLLIHTCGKGLRLVDGSQAIDLPTDGYPATRASVSKDGTRIAAAISDRTVRVWDERGRRVGLFPGHTDLVMDVAFSPDGTRLASASYDKTIRIWELATGRYRVLRGHSRAVDRVVWRSSTEIVSASYDGTIRVWPVPPIDAPTQDQINARLDSATTAVIDANNRATTTPR